VAPTRWFPRRRFPGDPVAVIAAAAAAAALVPACAGVVSVRKRPAAEAPPAPAFQEGLPQDHFPAILRPRFVPAGRARIAPDAPVFGVAADGEAHAYALRLLDGHEIVNDTVGRHRIVATW
jgi:hypothetical protein